MIVHHTRLRENGDLHLWEAPALRQKPVFLNVRASITRELCAVRMRNGINLGFWETAHLPLP